MRLNKLILALLIIYLLGCERTNDKLFWVTENAGQESDFLFLVESINIPKLKTDSLRLFFEPEELKVFDENSITFKNYGKIYEGQKFNAYILLMNMETVGRFYCFIIQTYDKDFRAIDTFELAYWDEGEKQYCFGSINKDLIIERRCNYKETSDLMQITEEGEIIMTSFNKP